MKEWFGDTSYFLALIGTRDAHHGRAVQLSRNRSVPLVTTTLVLTELADGMARPPALRTIFAKTLQSIEDDPTSTVIPVDDALHHRGLDLYLDRPDKEWSLTDCISFIVMEDRGIDEALTGDHHFEQAGFVALLRHDF